MKPPREAGPHSLLIGTMSVFGFVTEIKGSRGIGKYLRLSNHALKSYVAM